jgi:hypothetical protein
VQGLPEVGGFGRLRSWMPAGPHAWCQFSGGVGDHRMGPLSGAVRRDPILGLPEVGGFGRLRSWLPAGPLGGGLGLGQQWALPGGGGRSGLDRAQQTQSGVGADDRGDASRARGQGDRVGKARTVDVVSWWRKGGSGGRGSAAGPWGEEFPPLWWPSFAEALVGGVNLVWEWALAGSVLGPWLLGPLRV